VARYAVAHLDEIDELADGRYRYRPVRHHLGITSFGATAWTAHAVGDVIINEHDEDDPSADQELFLVLRGHAAFELEGERVDAPAGTLIFAPPRLRRRASADSTTWPAARASPAGRPTRSRISGTRSTCPRSFACTQSSIRTWTRSATNERSGN
jgi:hypothetical protein